MNKSFTAFSIGQAITMLGSALTSFGLIIWLYQNTDSISEYTLVMVFYVLPGALISPFLGRWVDKFGPKRMALLADFLAAISTLLILTLLTFNHLGVGQIYAVGIVSSVATVLKYAALSTLVPKLVTAEQLTRANGLLTLGVALSQLVGPLLAGVLLVAIGLHGVMVIDLIAFVVGALSFFFVHIPPNHSVKSEDNIEGKQERKSLGVVWYQDVMLVVRYLREDIANAGLFAYMSLQNFLMGMVTILVPPFILTNYTESELSVMLSVSAVGALIGAACVSIWPPKKLVNTIFIANIAIGFFVVILGYSIWLPVVYLCGFMTAIFYPMIESCEKSFWQMRVPSTIQGRFFSIKSAIDLAMLPAAAVISGALVENVFEPAMQVGGALQTVLSDWGFSGEARGIGVLFIVAGSLYTLVAMIILTAKMALPSISQKDQYSQLRINADDNS